MRESVVKQPPRYPKCKCEHTMLAHPSGPCLNCPCGAYETDQPDLMVALRKSLRQIDAPADERPRR